MRYAIGAAIVIFAASASLSWSQTSVIQQNNVSINGEGSSVTVSGRSISVDTTATGRGRVIGDGQPTSEGRPIGPVTAIRSDGAFALTVEIGPAPQLTIETDKNIMPIIKTTVSNGRLDIYSDQSYSVDGRIKITVSSPHINEISASGSNQIQGEGFTGGSLSIALNGSNSATLAGKLAALTCVMSGANHLAAQQLMADSAKLTLNGSGDASIDARQQIVAQISGAGSLTVYGNPKDRSTQITGAGKIAFVP
jgi:Putative auto-transporter adhesin, head GIN domain